MKNQKILITAVDNIEHFNRKMHNGGRVVLTRKVLDTTECKVEFGRVRIDDRLFKVWRFDKGDAWSIAKEIVTVRTSVIKLDDQVTKSYERRKMTELKPWKPFTETMEKSFISVICSKCRSFKNHKCGILKRMKEHNIEDANYPKELVSRNFNESTCLAFKKKTDYKKSDIILISNTEECIKKLLDIECIENVRTIGDELEIDVVDGENFNVCDGDQVFQNELGQLRIVEG